MEEHLRRIAEENVANRRKSGIASLIMILALPFFVMALKSEFQNVYWIIGAVIALVMGFMISMHYQNKVIGKKSAVDIELDRLKELHPEEKLELSNIDDAELKLREMVRSSNKDDMV